MNVLAVLLAGCSTGISLTGGGASVRDVAPVDVPAGCEMLGDVSIGIPPWNGVISTLTKR